MNNSVLELPRSKTLSNDGRIEIVNSLTDIEIKLKWEGKHGEFCENVELKSKHYTAIADIKASGEILREYASTLEIPKDYEVVYNEPEVNDVTVFDAGGDEVHVTDKQYNSLVYNIKKNIRIDD